MSVQRQNNRCHGAGQRRAAGRGPRARAAIIAGLATTARCRSILARPPHGRCPRVTLAGALLSLALLPGAVYAQDMRFRLFTSDNGLPESWVWEIARGASGRVWTTHGLPGLANFDGYRFRSTPIGDRLLAISEGPDGLLWALLTDPERRTCIGLQTLDSSGWTRYAVRELDGHPVGGVRLLAWAPGRVLVLTPARVLEFTARENSTRLIADAAAWKAGAFNALQPAAGGGAWVSATHTLLRIGRPSTDGVSAPTEVSLPPALRDAVWTSDLANTLLTVVHHPGDPSGVLVRHDGAGWTPLASGTKEQPLVAGWADTDRTIWIVRSSSSSFTVSLIEDGRPERTLSRRRSLSGVLNAIDPVSDGSFWLGTSVGLVRYQPHVWRRPPALADHEVQTGSVLETTSGEIVAIQQHALLRRTAQGWRSHPFPPGHAGNAYYAHVIGSLGDGRLVLGASMPGTPLIFDPASGGFEELRHPEGRSIEILGTRTPTGVWAITRLGKGPARIESYDGRGFHVRVQVDASWEGDDNPRHILETRNGDLIITPTPKGIAHVRGETLTWLAAPDFGDPHPFVAAELPDGTIWFGGREGLLAFTDERLIKLRDDLQTVRSIVVARDGAVWVASNSGVHRYANGHWVTNTDAEGLPAAAAFDVMEDHSGQMWVATSSGLSHGHAEADVDAPETVLAAENSFEAPPRGDVRIVFRASDRWASTPTRRLLYSYRLDDRPWSPFTGETAASLTGVAAGRHRFSVRAMDRNWNIDATPATVSFTVLSWYQEPGVRALGSATGLALGVAVALFFIRRRHDALRGELAERQRLDAERAGLEQQLRQPQALEGIGQLAAGVPRDFDQLLASICRYADLILDRTDQSDPSHNHAREIAKASAHAAALTRQLLSRSGEERARPEAVEPDGAPGPERPSAASSSR